MVGAAEGPGVHQRMPGIGHARHGVNFGGLQRFRPGHIRQDGGQTAGQHGLSGAGRADQQHVVAAGGGDLQGTLDVLLAHDIGEIRQGPVDGGGLPPGRGHDGVGSLQMGHQLAHILHTVDDQAVGQRGLGGVGGGDEELLHPLAGGEHGHGQHAGDGAHLAGEAQLTQEGGVLRQGADLARGGHNAQQDGQVVHRALLPDAGRGQIDGDAADGELGPAVFHRGTHPLTGLLHRRVRQTHHVKGGQTAGEHALHRYLIAADAGQAQRTHRGHHRLRSSPR